MRKAQRVHFSDAKHARASDPQRYKATSSFTEARRHGVPRRTTQNSSCTSHSSFVDTVFQPLLCVGNPRTPLLTVSSALKLIRRSGPSGIPAQSSSGESPNGASTTRRRSSSGLEDTNDSTPLLQSHKSPRPGRRHATAVQSDTASETICDCLHSDCTLS